MCGEKRHTIREVYPQLVLSGTLRGGEPVRGYQEYQLAAKETLIVALVSRVAVRISKP